MSPSRTSAENEFQHPSREFALDVKTHAATKAELVAALAREEAALHEKDELLLRQNLLAEEFEHRLVNSLQLIVSLLSLQSRGAPTIESAAQLTIAAGRVASIGARAPPPASSRSSEERRVQTISPGFVRRSYGPVPAGRRRAARSWVTGADVILPSALAIPLGFIVNEMITNSVKYATGNIAVGVETSATGNLLSVSDDGPGLSPAFDPRLSKGLGMKIIQTLVKQIGGTLQFGAGDRGRGARFTVAFAPHP